MLAIEAASFTLRIGASFSTSGKMIFISLPWIWAIWYWESKELAQWSPALGLHIFQILRFWVLIQPLWRNGQEADQLGPTSSPVQRYIFFVKITFHQKFLPQKPSRWKVVQYLVDQPLWLLGTQDCGCSSFYLVQYLWKIVCSLEEVWNPWHQSFDEQRVSFCQSRNEKRCRQFCQSWGMILSTFYFGFICMTCSTSHFAVGCFSMRSPDKLHNIFAFTHIHILQTNDFWWEPIW